MHIELPLPQKGEDLHAYLQQLVTLLQVYINHAQPILGQISQKGANNGK